MAGSSRGGRGMGAQEGGTEEGREACGRAKALYTVNISQQFRAKGSAPWCLHGWKWRAGDGWSGWRARFDDQKNKEPTFFAMRGRFCPPGRQIAPSWAIRQATGRAVKPIWACIPCLGVAQSWGPGAKPRLKIYAARPSATTFAIHD